MVSKSPPVYTFRRASALISTALIAAPIFSEFRWETGDCRLEMFLIHPSSPFV
jgi:hypothetical protein